MHAGKILRVNPGRVFLEKCEIILHILVAAPVRIAWVLDEARRDKADRIVYAGRDDGLRHRSRNVRREIHWLPAELMHLADSKRPKSQRNGGEKNVGARPVQADDLRI